MRDQIKADAKIIGFFVLVFDYSNPYFYSYKSYN
ncbi:unknown [[Mannheimia] succiniciproducens MBEL55E]|uniref:Uncharacterized protein n=1 Tax=Mannheimia succiniciproducens (strain KCTC 0769BP / MBEL55E) TaxID=221988 RepID=Q65TM5_MANSM|nr:unknown [[Mannheimia] succiniciproducens MBEL55E]